MDCAIAQVSRVPYPIDRDTALALDAASKHAVMTRSELERFCEDQVREKFVDEGSIEIPQWPIIVDPFDLHLEFETNETYEAYVSGTDYHHGLTDVHDRVFEQAYDHALDDIRGWIKSGELKRGGILRLVSVPFSDVSLKYVPVIAGRWIDRHFIYLAEWCTHLLDRGFTRLPALDDHPLAFDRFFPPRTNWSRPNEADDSQIATAEAEAKAHLDKYPGRTRNIEGRVYLHFRDYARWPDRWLRGDFKRLYESGVSLQSWNDCVVRRGNQEGMTTFYGVMLDVFDMDPDFREGQDFVVIDLTPPDDEEDEDMLFSPIDVRRKLAKERSLRKLILSKLVEFGQEEYHPSKLVPNKFQRAILFFLDKRALRTGALADELASLAGAPYGKDPRRRLFKPRGLLELKESGLVKNHPKVGFYRPDAPPPELKKILGRAPKGH
jgi:hypothetical protein